MHPLPPSAAPTSPVDRSRSQQHPPERPSVAPLQAPMTQDNSFSKQPSAQASTQSKKRRKNRQKKTQRQRKQSFADSSGGPAASANASDAMTQQSRTEKSKSAPRAPFYRLGQSGVNLSSTSLESQALLDHREQPMMRPRRESRVSQGAFMERRVGVSPNDNIHSTYRRHHSNSITSPDALRRHHGVSKMPGLTGEDDSDEGRMAHDRIPLISHSMRQGRSPDYAATAGGSTPRQRLQQRHGDSASTRSSLRQQDKPSREASFMRNERAEYDVNNPPSVPSSPVSRPEMEDVMFGAGDFDLQQPSRRDTRPFGNDALIDIDPQSQSLPENGAEPPGLGVSRSKTIALPVDDDVCFPTGEMSEIAEEDSVSPHPGEQQINGPRRRRRRMWPDLTFLEDWSHSENIALHQETRVKKVSEPVLVGGRLRPSGQGWHRIEEDSPYRYTYFNEEFESTIHSQTISELVQPGCSFQELFIPDPPQLEAESTSEEEESGLTTRDASGDKISSSPHTIDQNDDDLGKKRSASLLSELQSGSRNASVPTSGRATPQPNNISKPPRPKRYGPRPTFWLDVLCPTSEEMRVLAKAFGIHGLTVEDIMMQETREKVELFRNYYFINYRTFEQDKEDDNYLEPINIYIIVFREGVLSFHFSQSPHPANVRRRIRQLKDYLILSADWISYAIIDDITDAFQPLIQGIEDEVDFIDERILQLHSDTINSAQPASAANNEKRSDAGEENSPGIDMLRKVGDCRKKVMGLYRLLGNKADVIKGFAKRCTEQWDVAPKSEIGLYLGDIQDHILTMTSNLNHYETLLSRAHSNYLAQITIRMNERQEQSADILGKLTVLGTIVLPMNIICGMWGMNVKVPGQEVDSLTWFWCITAGLILFAVVCVVVARRVYGIV